MFIDTKYSKQTITFLKVGLSFIFILYLISVNLFHHVHIVDGQIILHSHLYTGQEGTSAEHSHTKAEIQLIQHLMNVETAGSTLPIYVIIKFQNKPIRLFTQAYQSIVISVAEKSFFLRPPPVV